MSAHTLTYCGSLGYVKRVLCYIKGTLHYGLLLRKFPSNVLHAFTDFDCAGSPENRKSTSGYVLFLGSNLISWSCQKQKIVARSSTEAEYKALADVSAEVARLVAMLRELELPISVSPKMWCDNLGATYLRANPVFHARTNCVEIDYHFVCDKVTKG